jgi:hypothetical protein
MNDKTLKNLIRVIESNIFTTMWYDGCNYHFLDKKVYFADDEAKAYYKDSSDYIDLYNITLEDFKFFRNEIDLTNIIEEMGL